MVISSSLSQQIFQALPTSLSSFFTSSTQPSCPLAMNDKVPTPTQIYNKLLGSIFWAPFFIQMGHLFGSVIKCFRMSFENKENLRVWSIIIVAAQEWCQKRACKKSFSLAPVSHRYDNYRPDWPRTEIYNELLGSNFWAPFFKTFGYLSASLET